MSCHICNRTFTEGCLADWEAIPYIAFVIRHPHGHQRLYAGKINGRGTAGYGVLTPGGTQHFVKFHRIRCVEPRIFNDMLRLQCEKKHFAIPQYNPEIYDTVYSDFQVFGD